MVLEILRLPLAANHSCLEISPRFPYFYSLSKAVISSAIHQRDPPRRGKDHASKSRTMWAEAPSCVPSHKFQRNILIQFSYFVNFVKYSRLCTPIENKITTSDFAYTTWTLVYIYGHGDPSGARMSTLNSSVSSTTPCTIILYGWSSYIVISPSLV